MRNLIPLFAIILIGLSACDTFRNVPSRRDSRGVEIPVQYSTTGDRNQDYVTRFKDAALLEMERGGVPASIILAQGILESGAGSSDLAKQANNHFGVKCGGSWNGKTYYKQDDDRDKDGKLIESCFRRYEDVSDSYYDHGEFLRDPKKHNRYGFLFNLDRTDYRAWARGLQSAGYATNPTYADQLINLIERYRLYEFDRPGGNPLPPGTKPFPPNNAGTGTGTNTTPGASTSGGNTTTPPGTTPSTGGTPGAGTSTPRPNLPPAGAGRIQRVNDVKVVLSREGETLDDIANAYRLNTLRVADYNDRGYLPGVVLKPNTRIFIQNKKDKWRGRASEHYVREGQNMFDISQVYGIKLSKLRSRNRMQANEEPAVGEKLCLRGTRPKNVPVKLRDTSKDPTRPNTTPNANTPRPPSSMTPNTDDVLFEIGGEDPKPNQPNNPPNNTSNPAPAKPTGPGRPSTTGNPYPGDPTPSQPNNNNWNNGNNTNTTPPPSNNINGQHTIVKGDTLYSISRKYSITVSRLKQLNNLPDDSIRIGQTLRVQ
jgi:LysM repeat protein